MGKFFCTLFFLCMLSKDFTVKADEFEVGWTIRWQGLVCSGNYYGEMKDGKPEGKGSFSGKIYLSDDKLGDEVEYEGMWKQGQLNGQGVLTNLTTGTVYEGKFSGNKLNGKITIYTEDERYMVQYSKDVPYGISYKYDSEGNMHIYDRYVYGQSVNELVEEAECIEYRDLLYYSDEFVNKVIKLKCTVKDATYEYIEKNIYQSVKVEDNIGNNYVLRFSLEYPTKAENYMPRLSKNEKVVVIGFCSGIDAFGEEIIKYPLIEAICTEDYEENKECTYNNFINYPYEFYKTDISLEGIYSGIISISEKWIYFLVESDDYSGMETDKYFCRVRNLEKNYKKLPLPGESISLQGVLVLVGRISIDEEYEFVPIVELTKILQ